MTTSCHTQCLSEIDYTACMDKCSDADLIAAVTAKFGEEAGKSCIGYSRGIERSLYRMDPNFEVAGTALAKTYPTVQQPVAEKYFQTPKAPYPPSVDTPPFGVRDKLPYYQGYLDFLKGPGRPCWEYQMRMKLAAAKAAAAPAAGLGEDTPESRGPLLLGLVVLAGAAYAALRA